MLLESLVVEGVEVRVQMRRNARRITMHVRPPHGQISVIIPYGTAKSEVLETLQQYWPKLKTYRQGIVDKYEQEAPSRGQEGDGECIWDRVYRLRFKTLTAELAREVEAESSGYVLRHNRGRRPRPIKAVLRCEGDELIYYHSGERPTAHEATKVIDLFLDDVLLGEATADIKRYGEIMGCFHKVKTVVIKHVKSRWGHCKPFVGEVMVNGRLARLPRHCLSYIVVHELCHFTYMGHGPDFYGLQERYYPQWRESRKALQLYPLKK